MKSFNDAIPINKKASIAFRLLEWIAILSILSLVSVQCTSDDRTAEYELYAYTTYEYEAEDTIYVSSHQCYTLFGTCEAEYYEYDQNRLVAVRSSQRDSQIVRIFQYDSLGNRIRIITSPDSDSVVFRYSGTILRESIMYSDGQAYNIDTFEYDSLGRQSRRTSHNLSIGKWYISELFYDERNRLTRAEMRDTIEIMSMMTFEYGSNGRLAKSEEHCSGQSVRNYLLHFYDDRDRLVRSELYTEESEY